MTPPGAKLSVADATKWNSPEALLASAAATAALPVVVGQVALPPSQPVYLALQQLASGGGAELPVYRDVSKNTASETAAGDQPAAIYKDSDLPKVFAGAEQYRQRNCGSRRGRDAGPDFINAAAAALNIAADAVWDDKQQSFMHGAVAWRTRLLGWRGHYAGDALGWHERTAAHFAGFAKQQNISPIPATIPPADEQFNLARNEAASTRTATCRKIHYDMNLVAVDAFFRHLLWTGDTNYAAQMWPVIERHLAWERRLFRREFGPDKLPLYEAYAAIWASDDLNYNGGGTAHASAYNYFANKMAARVAKILGKDPAPYETRGGFDFARHEQISLARGRRQFCRDARICSACNSCIRTPASGHFITRWIPKCRRRSRRGRCRAGLTTTSRTSRFSGPNVPDENLFTLPETSWMPYQWSLNNVVMAEAAHTSLGFWQANRPETAFQLFKGELLDSMFLGLCPGNVGAMTWFDMARGEAQRDFGDAIGVNSRALVEGLFGIKPDALAGELKIVPGFPAKWDHASIRHPDFNFAFRREGLTETFVIEQKFSKPMALDLRIAALRDGVASVTVNGQEPKSAWVQGEVGLPRLEIGSIPAARMKLS